MCEDKYIEDAVFCICFCMCIFYSFVVMSFKNDSFEIKKLSINIFELCRLPRKIKLETGDALEIFYWNFQYEDPLDTRKWKIDTLVYYLNNFIEITDESEKYGIE